MTSNMELQHWRGIVAQFLLLMNGQHGCMPCSLAQLLL